MKLLTPEEVLQAIKDRKPVEVKFGDNYEWELVRRCEMNIDELLNPEHSFRFPQPTITVASISFPKPETKPLKMGTAYWYVDLLNTDLFLSDTWDNMKEDRHRLQIGSIHLTEENAIAHAKALIKLSGGTYE